MVFKKAKTLILVSLIISIALSVLLSKTTDDSYYAATVLGTTETTKRKTVGHKIEGAEFHEELWDKINVIAADNGGGSSEGGGAGDSNSSNAGNKGAYSDAGGTFGEAAGVGLGTGNKANQSGTGSGVSGGSTGSVVADALRKMKADIEESRAESIAKVLETAKDAESVAASIAERESIQASIQKKLQQESIKNKIAQAEFQKQYETPVYVETTTRKITYESSKEITEPNVVNNVKYYDLDNKMPVKNDNSTVYDNNDIVPSEMNVYDYDQANLLQPTTRKVDDYSDSTVEKPTGEEKQVESQVTNETIETFDSPIIEEETTTDNKNQELSDVEEGKGSKGGKDAEADEDMTGNDGENESMGNANDRGKYQQETEGEYAGKKVFELKQNGNLGLDPEHLSVTGLRGLVSAVITLLFLLGALLFVLSTRDRFKRDNYF